MKIKITKVGLSVFLIVTFSCNSQKTEWQGTIEEVDGVTVVKNPKEPMYGEDVFNLEEEITIGDRMIERGVVFQNILSYQSIEADDSGNIYVLDEKACKVFVFDENGKELRSFGRKGQGPGELQGPSGIRIINKNEILLYDYTNKRVSYFSLGGELLNEISAVKIPGLFRPLADSDGNLIGLNMISEKKTVFELMKYSSDFEHSFTVGKFETSRVVQQKTITPLIPQICYEVLNDDNIIWGIQTEYELKIVDRKGNIKTKINKEYEPVPVTEFDKEKRLERLFNDRPIPSGFKIEFPKYFWPYNLITSDDEGRIFVQTYERATNGKYYFDVFDNSGRYLAKINLKEYPIIWKMKKLYSVEEDEEGYQYIKRYKVTWNY